MRDVWIPPAAETRRLSRAIFGSQSMLPVIDGIARLHDPFTYWDVVNVSGVEYHEVRSRILKLDRAGLVCRLVTPPGGLEWWSAMPSPLWDHARALFADLEGAARE